MRILKVVFSPVGKGTYWRTWGFGRELARRGHEVTVLTAGKMTGQAFTERDVEGVRLVETASRWPGTGYDLGEVWRRLGWLKERPFDLIHAYETRPVTLGPAYWARRQGIVLFFDWCDWFGRGGSVEERPSRLTRTVLRPVETFFEERFRGWAQGTTVINTILGKKAQALGVPAEQILLLPNGIDVSHIRPFEQTAVRQTLRLPLQTPLLGYTGAIFQRDAQLMAAAFSQIVAQRPGTELLLIGYFNAPIEQWVGESVRQAIRRTGPLSSGDVVQALAACDVGWLPLVNSGANQGRFPMKVHDFMAAQRPLAVTDVGDLGAFVRDNNLGLVSTDNAEAIAKTVLAVLDAPERGMAWGRNGRLLAETQLTWEHMTDRLEAFYKSRLAQK